MTSHENEEALVRTEVVTTESHTGQALLLEADHWHPKGDVIVASSGLVEIDELNPSGRSSRLTSSQAAVEIGQLMLMGDPGNLSAEQKRRLRAAAALAMKEEGLKA